MLTKAEAELVQTVENLSKSEFSERAAAVDREGRFPADNVKALQSLKVPGMGMPTSFGGGGMSAEARLRVVEAVAYGCGSTAVALNMHFFVADTLLLNPAPTEAAMVVTRDVAANQALMCGPGSIATTGLDTRTAGFRAREEADALVVNGKAGFASMSEGATYVFISGTVDRGEGVEPDLFFATPRHDTPGLTNLRNWDGMGFRGTASHDIQMDDVRIPKSAALVVPATFFEMLGQISAGLPAPVRQGRAVGALGILAIWLGLSQAALDFTKDYVQQRYGVTPLPGPGSEQIGMRADDAWAQIAIGEMAHWVETGRTVLYDFASRMDTPYPSAGEFNRAFGIAIYHLRRMCEEVAIGSMKVCGAHAYVKNRPLERIYRDLTGCVVMAWKTGLLAQQVGLATLGRPFVIGGPIAVG